MSDLTLPGQAVSPNLPILPANLGLPTDGRLQRMADQIIATDRLHPIQWIPNPIQGSTIQAYRTTTDTIVHNGQKVPWLFLERLHQECGPDGIQRVDRAAITPFGDTNLRTDIPRPPAPDTYDTAEAVLQAAMASQHWQMRFEDHVLNPWQNERATIAASGMTSTLKDLDKLARTNDPQHGGLDDRWRTISDEPPAPNLTAPAADRILVQVDTDDNGSQRYLATAPLSNLNDLKAGRQHALAIQKQTYVLMPDLQTEETLYALQYGLRTPQLQRDKRSGKPLLDQNGQPVPVVDEHGQPQMDTLWTDITREANPEQARVLLKNVARHFNYNRQQFQFDPDGIRNEQRSDMAWLLDASNRTNERQQPFLICEPDAPDQPYGQTPGQSLPYAEQLMADVSAPARQPGQTSAFDISL